MTRLYRSREERKIAGVCGGLSEAFDVDVTLVRLAAVFLCLASGVVPLVVTYLVAWWIIPLKSPGPTGHAVLVR